MKPVPANRPLIFGLLVLAGLAIDLYSKHRVFAGLGIGGQSPWTYEWFGGWMTFRLATTYNEGALWGLGQGLAWLFASLSVVAVLVIGYFLFVRGAARSAWLTVSLGLIMAGALGNLYDRLGWHGLVKENGEPLYAVRDFLYFTFGEFGWPVFNFADVFLVSGAIMLVLQSLCPDPQPEETPAAAPARENAPVSP